MLKKNREKQGLPDMSGLFDRRLKRADDVLRRRELSILVRPSLNVFAQCAPSDSHIVSVYQLVFQQVAKNLCRYD